MALKPDSLSWEQAVAIPFGANTALYFLRDLGKIRAGQDLLIIGASGAIGSAGVQLAKHFGARVTGVCSGPNVELVTALGADSVIDYTREDFTKSGNTYDLIFDVVGATTFDRCRRSLKPNGVFLQNIMELSDIVRVLWTSITGGKKSRAVWPWKHGEHGSHHRTCRGWEAQAGHRQKLSVGADRGSLQVR